MISIFTAMVLLFFFQYFVPRDVILKFLSWYTILLQADILKLVKELIKCVLDVLQRSCGYIGLCGEISEEGYAASNYRSKTHRQRHHCFAEG